MKRRFLPVLALLCLVSITGCAGIPRSADTPAISRLARDWWRFFPIRYGNSRSLGGSFLDFEGSFVDSPDGKWRVTVANSVERSGHELRIGRPSDDTSRMLFSAAALEPDPYISVLEIRAIWAGDSLGIYATVQPTESPHYAQTYFVALDGTAQAISSPTWVGANTVLAPVPMTTAFLVQDLAEPMLMSVMDVGGSILAQYEVAEGGLLVFEDAEFKYILLSQIPDLSTPGPFYSAAPDNGELLKLGEGWCPRFRPGGKAITYLRRVTDGFELMELDRQSGVSTALATLAGIVSVRDCLWEAADSVLVLGDQGNSQDLILRVRLGQPR